MIGVFDSGVGGLSVLHALEHLLPQEDFIYFADSAHFPYGNKTSAEILRYTSQITAFLLSKNIKLLVIACHSASAIALKPLQKNFPIPIIGMIEPTLKITPLGKIAILATKSTFDTGVYQKALPDLIQITCPELVEKIQLGKTPLHDSLKKCLEPLTSIDALVLGCTHYSFIAHEIEEELDSHVKLIDPAFAVAEEVARELKNVQSDHNSTSKHTFFVSGDIEPFQTFLNKHPPKNKNFEVHFFQ